MPIGHVTPVPEWVNEIKRRLVPNSVLSRLSLRELWVVFYVMKGYRYKKMSEETGLGANYLKQMMPRIFDRVGAESQLQIAILVSEEMSRNSIQYFTELENTDTLAKII
jgi:DNA-binding CsgD family transcriptional regulator